MLHRIGWVATAQRSLLPLMFTVEQCREGLCSDGWLIHRVESGLVSANSPRGSREWEVMGNLSNSDPDTQKKLVVRRYNFIFVAVYFILFWLYLLPFILVLVSHAQEATVRVNAENNKTKTY